MKRLSYLLLTLVLLGAGCADFGGKSKTPDGGVFKTADAGTTWTQIVAVPTSQGMGTLATSDVLNMELDPADKFFLYAGTRGNGMVYSEDAGASWRLPRQAALRDGSILNVEVDPANSCVAYMAKGNRLYKTTNCLRTFDDETYVETRAGLLITQVAIDWYTKGTVWIGLSNGDVLKSTDDGKSWKKVLKMADEISEIVLSNKDSRQVIVSGYKNGMQRSTDGGDHWEKVEGNITKLTNASQVYAFSQTNDGGTLIAATQYGLLRSKDFGMTWESINLLTSPGQVLIRAVAVAPKDSNIIYYATPGTFYRTSDGGQTWQTQKFPSTRIPRALLVDPDDSSVLYVGVASPAE